MKFMYSTLKSVREFGVIERSVNDKKVNSLIEFYSKLCNRMISKHFIPVREVSRFSGSGTKVLRTGGRPKIIKINSISIIHSDAARTVIEGSKYTYQGNTIMHNYNFPIGYNNIEIDAIYGEVENIKEIEVETLTEINSESTTVQLNSVEELDIRDVLVIENRVFIINDIEYDTNIIHIDTPIDKKVIPIGSKLYCYGAVPLEIERAINLLIKHNKVLESQVGGRIKSEKTDGYSYEMFSNQFYTTGIAEVDNIFQSFTESDFILEYL